MKNFGSALFMTAFVSILGFTSQAMAFAWMQVSPSWVNLSNADVNGYAQQRIVTVTNYSSTETIRFVQVSRYCGMDFRVSDTCYTDLRPMQSCQVRVAYKPSSAGRHSCLISVNGSNASGVRIHVNGTAHDRSRGRR